MQKGAERLAIVMTQIDYTNHMDQYVVRQLAANARQNHAVCRDHRQLICHVKHPTQTKAITAHDERSNNR